MAHHRLEQYNKGLLDVLLRKRTETDIVPGAVWSQLSELRATDQASSTVRVGVTVSLTLAAGSAGRTMD